MSNRKTAETNAFDAKSFEANAAEATKTFTDMFALPAFGQMQDQFRTALENGINQWRNQFDTAQKAFAKSSTAAEGTLEAVSGTFKTLGEKAMAAAKSNGEATIAFSNALLNAKTLSDVIELQTTHARKAVESLMAQGKDFTETTRKSATDIAAKAKALVPAAA